MNEPAPLRGKLLNSVQLLEALWDAESRPSIRWLRSQTRAKAIPHIRIGRLIFFDVEMVKASLARRNIVQLRRSSEGI